MLRTNLENALQRSNDWLQSEIEAWFSTNTVREPSPIMFRKLKAICEIGYLEYFVNPSPNLKIKDQIDKLITALIEEDSFKSLVRHNIEHSNLFIPLLSIYLSKKTISIDEKIDVVNLIKYNLQSSKERLPFREIDLLHITYKITLDKFYLNEINKIAQFGCLGKFKNIISFSNSDEYALTHTIFYVTDFGKFNWNEDILTKTKLCKLLTILSKQAKDKGDIDIFGEYVLCKQYLNFSTEVIEADLIQLLELQNNNLGYWNGPTELKNILIKEGFDKEALCFFENYHTSIVVRLAIYNYVYKFEKSKNVENSFIVSKLLNLETTFSYNEQSILNRLCDDYIDVFRIIVAYQKFQKIEILEYIYSNPTSILLGLDILHLYFRHENTLRADEMSIFNDLLDIDVLNQDFDIRFIRIWCLAKLIFNGINEEYAERVLNKYQLLSNTNEDKSIVLLILYNKFSNKLKHEVQKTIDDICLKSIAERDMNMINYFLFYGIDNDKLLENYFDELLTLFLSMNSVTLSYGWLENSDTADANYYDVLSLITAVKLEKKKIIVINALINASTPMPCKAHPQGSTHGTA